MPGIGFSGGETAAGVHLGNFVEHGEFSAHHARAGGTEPRHRSVERGGDDRIDAVETEIIRYRQTQAG